MRLLLDTHAFLWFAADDPRLSRTAAATIADLSNERALSIASVWEMAIKHAKGKLAIPEPLHEFIRNQAVANRTQLLPVALEPAVAVAARPPHHQDPFDRLLIAQAILLDIPVVSADAVFDRYPIRRIW